VSNASVGGGSAAGGPPQGAPGGRPRPEDVRQGVREKLKEETERIPLKALERRGFKSVQVLDMKTIEGIVSDAVEKVVKRRDEALTAEERATLEKDAKAEFLKLLGEHKQLRAQKDEVEVKRRELEEQVERLRQALHGQQQELSVERQRPVGDGIRFSQEAIGELDRKVRGLFKELLRDEQRRTLAELGPKALKGLSELERELAQLLERLLNDERERWIERERAEHQQKIDMLERRIEKLNKALKDTEHTLHAVAQAKGIDHGLASIYGWIQGLNFDDPNFGRKTELLKEVFVQNLELRGRQEALAAVQSGRPLPPPPPSRREAAPPPGSGPQTPNDGAPPPLVRPAAPPPGPRPSPPLPPATPAAAAIPPASAPAAPAPGSRSPASMTDFIARIASSVGPPAPPARIEFKAPTDVKELETESAW